MTTRAFVQGIIYTPEQTVSDGVILVEGGQIRQVGARDQVAIPPGAEIIDAMGKVIAPGLVDIHTYGCLGVSITAPERAGAELAAFARHVARFGVTRFLISPTIGDRAFIARTLSALADAIPTVRGGARPLGIHLEGPWLDPEQRGFLRVATLAPNLPNALEIARFLRDHDVRVSLGHSNTDYEFARAALATGVYSLVTHVYNAMSGLHHRKPGVLGAVLNSDDVMGMLICDGIHAHPAAVKILLRVLGTNRVILVTDAIPGGGMTEGTFTMLNQTARIVDGVARLNDGTIAGSILTLNRAVMNARAFGGLTLNDALKLATLNPARALGLASRGILTPGAEADVIVMDDAGNVALTMVAGEIVFRDS